MRGNFNKYCGADNPNYKDGRKGTRLYSIYNNMLTRCNNPNSTHYHRYGGRGIKVCGEWENSFESFYKWATSNGYSETLTLDRHDNDGNYEPSNCRWRTVREQTLNTSRNHLIEFGGEIKPLTKWCSEFDINPKTVRDRLSRGWEIEKALKTPPDRRWSH